MIVRRIYVRSTQESIAHTQTIICNNKKCVTQHFMFFYMYVCCDSLNKFHWQNKPVDNGVQKVDLKVAWKVMCMFMKKPKYKVLLSSHDLFYQKYYNVNIHHQVVVNSLFSCNLTTTQAYDTSINSTNIAVNCEKVKHFVDE